MRGGDRVGLPVHLGEVPVHVGELLDRLHDRVAEQVGERDLAAAGPLEMVVDDDAVVDHQLGRDRAHARRGRHIQRRRHVLHDGSGRAAQHLRLVAVGGGGAAFVPPASGSAVPSVSRAPTRFRPVPASGASAFAARLGLGGGGLGLARWPRHCPAVACGAGAGPGSRGADGCGRSVRRRRRSTCLWSIRASSRPGIHANSDRPRRDPRGTCGTSPRPTTRSVRMVKLNCSRQLLASIPSVRQESERTPARLYSFQPAVTRIYAA